MTGPKARFVRPLEDGGGQCGLCPHACVIPQGKRGRCGVRENRDGEGSLPFYGHITALAQDPIEKKPLYHYRPGSVILSAGFAGCNLRCPFCQNHHISQAKNPPGSYMPPGALAALARERGFEQIGYTYSEPLVHIEFLLDCMAAARDAGIANVLVSSGCVSPEAASLILPLIDAANIDLKCFSQETYTRILKGDMAAALAFTGAAFERGVHLEVTTLIVPGLNDGEEALESAAAFLAGISPRIPWHLSACHPAWKWNGPPPQPRFLAGAAVRARKTLAFVYTGNTPGASSTQCPSCGALLVRRQAYRIDTQGLRLKDGAYYCGCCGAAAPFRR